MPVSAIFVALAAGRVRTLAEDPIPRRVVNDELFVTLRVPADLSDAVRLAMVAAELLTRLRVTVRAAVQACPALASVRVTVTRQAPPRTTPLFRGWVRA